MNDFRPIADYGLLGDCNSAALVDRYGSVDWLCLPRYDSDAVFSRILDPDAGHWSIRPVGAFSTERRYLPGTLVLETTFTVDTGTVKLLDAMSFADGQRGHDLGIDAPHELLRGVEGVSGEMELEMELAPRPQYGLIRPLVRIEESGVRTFGAVRLGLSSSAQPEVDDESVIRSKFTVAGGDRLGFAVRWAAAEQSGPPAPTPADEVFERIGDTAEAWRSWEADHDIYEGPNKEVVRLSSRVLKGLSYRPTGAIVAAPTTSLPETVGGERNWDYRFSWIRDSSLTIEALYIAACPEEVEEFVSFMTSSAGGRASEGSLQIMYGIGGEHDLSERELPHLRGWRDSAPVRVGNGAWNQVQLDVYGELLNSLWLYRENLGDLHPEIQRFVADLANTAARRWKEKDSGMWEMRGEPRHHVSSKVFCWLALDRAVKLEERLGAYTMVGEWTAARDEIRDAVLKRGWSEKRRAFAQSFDSDELDGAQLLMPLVGFLPATDDRMKSTIEAIAEELTEDGFVLRYRNREGVNADGLMGEEGTFTICTFWLAACLAQAGELERAEELFSRLTGYANDLGLLAEEIDPVGREQLGNFPQAFSHVGLILAAYEIDKARGRDGMSDHDVRSHADRRGDDSFGRMPVGGDFAARMYAAINARDRGVIRSLCAPDLVVGTTVEAYRGPEAVLEWLDEGDDAFDDFSVELLEVEEVRGQVLVTMRQRGRGKASGADVDNHLTHVWTLRDGRGTRLKSFAHRDDAVRYARGDRLA
jgi:alpha,alpha-trehalase